MKQILKENGGLPASILWTLAIVAGISVANLYYNQPLLNMIRHELGVSEFETNLIAMVTQIGYALGLLFIVPLGDLYQRKRIILTSFSILIVSLLVIAMAPNIHVILCASLLTGICSVMPQIFIPIASQFSRPENKGRNVGIVVSGLLTGILASRVVSGFIGELFGWREIVLHRCRHDVDMWYGSHAGITGHTPELSGQIQRLNEVFAFTAEAVSRAPHLFSPRRTCFRFISSHVVMSGI